MKSVQLYKEHLQQFVSAEELANISEELLKAKETLVSGSGKGNDFLGWVDLPKEISPDIIDNIKKDVANLTPKARLFVVIGIGGSYLGARAVIEALQSEFASMEKGDHPFVIYAGHTLSEDYYHQLQKVWQSQCF